ncbi:hypothetical protein N751_01600 [Legionella pneumophila str. Leg01/11]|nr:hypothetical protein N751_01600 [Legionella pneumophila str. Leg01/11]ERH44544.1 hypothetical protein N750_08790 [Legionella pneumophila str. Leg01/53]ERI48443.1 hypothetical protein N749_09510 [Legionella pneumophila str. Leg01/20]
MWILKPIDLPDTAPVFISPEEMQNLKRICNLIHNKKQFFSSVKASYCGPTNAENEWYQPWYTKSISKVRKSLAISDSPRFFKISNPPDKRS